MTSRSATISGAKRIGLIAGSGRFPILFAEAARRMDMEVVALAIEGVTDPALDKIAGKLEHFKLGQIGKPIAFLKRLGVTRAVMAGAVPHGSLFGGIRPDWRAAKLLARLRDRRADTILQAVADEFSKDGIELLSSSTYLSHLIAHGGSLARRKPNSGELLDLDLGWRAAKALAGFDIGQTVVVQGGVVVAVEAMEGTDACIRRASELSRSNGSSPALVVVKVAKPRQDPRFDLPAVGLDSITTFERWGVRVLALEAGRALIFDKAKFLQEADRLGLAVLAREAGCA